MTVCDQFLDKVQEQLVHTRLRATILARDTTRKQARISDGEKQYKQHLLLTDDTAEVDYSFLCIERDNCMQRLSECSPLCSLTIFNYYT